MYDEDDRDWHDESEPEYADVQYEGFEECSEPLPTVQLSAAALYLDSSPKCEQVGAGDSPSCLGSPRPLVSRGVARHRRSSKARTVDRGSQPASGKAGSRRAQSHGEGR